MRRMDFNGRHQQLSYIQAGVDKVKIMQDQFFVVSGAKSRDLIIIENVWQILILPYILHDAIVLFD